MSDSVEILGMVSIIFVSMVLSLPPGIRRPWPWLRFVPAATKQFHSESSQEDKDEET